MKIDLKNKYGYKVCYTEKHYKNLHTRFKTRTYKQAVEMKRFYYTYPPDNIKRPKWFVIPISKSEVRNGIWRENPF